MLPEDLLKLAAEELALALLKSLPESEQCQHHFSEEFENKINVHIFHVEHMTSIE